MSLPAGDVDFIAIEDDVTLLGKIVKEEAITHAVEGVAGKIQVQFVDLVAVNAGVAGKVVVAGVE